MIGKRGKWILLIAAGALLVAAFLWNAHLSATSEGARLCRTVNEFGYALHPDDLYPAGVWNDTSIRALLPETELAEAVAASKSAGFPSDIDRAGQVTLVMANVGDDDVVTLYLVEGEIELGFVQVTGTGAVRALGAR